MFVSVVIPAYNEEECLGDCLRALRRQTFPAEQFEVIVVDNASSDATAAVARRLGARVVTEPRKGVSRARQAGFEAARGQVIASTDADTRVPPDWLARIAAHFAQDPALGGFYGPVRWPDGRPVEQLMLRYPGTWALWASNRAGRSLWWGSNPDPDLMPTPAQRDQLRRLGAARLRTSKPIFVIDFWNDAPYAGGCIAGGRYYIHVNSQGGVEPCIFTHFAVDNVKDKSLADCLCSPYFLAIRRRQPFSDDLLRPCMLIDHPQVFREIYAECRPAATHPGALSLVNELRPRLDEYAQGMAPIMDRAWQEDFVARSFRPPAGPVRPCPEIQGGAEWHDG